MSQKTNELSKESNLVLRKFKKGEISSEDYMKEFMAVKTKHFKANYTQLALQTKQQQI